VIPAAIEFVAVKLHLEAVDTPVTVIESEVAAVRVIFPVSVVAVYSAAMVASCVVFVPSAGVDAVQLPVSAAFTAPLIVVAFRVPALIVPAENAAGENV
jgi:hypothetical protein